MADRPVVARKSEPVKAGDRLEDKTRMSVRLVAQRARLWKLLWDWECKEQISTNGRMDAHEGTCFHAQEKVYGFQLANPKQSVGTRGNGMSDELAHHAFLIQG